MTNFSRYSPFLAAAIIGLLLSCVSVKADSVFSFRKFTGLRTGDRFAVLVHPRPSFDTTIEVGEGMMNSLGPKRMQFHFKAKYLTREISGQVKILYLRSEGSEDILQLDYSGVDNGKNFSLSEIVRADGILAAGNILTFQFDSSTKFFQFSRDSRGRNKMISDWGACILEKRPPIDHQD